MAAPSEAPIGVRVEILPHAANLPLPAYATPRASGMDLLAAVPDTVTIEPGARVLVPTGLRIAVPDGFEAQVRPRSGLALRQGLTIPNAPGTIDNDFRGELCVILANIGSAPVPIERGYRIAQIVFAPVVRARWEVCTALDETARGTGGFGHTGTGPLSGNAAPAPASRS